MKRFLLLASLLLVIGCNNVETKNVTKKISKQESVDEPPKPGSIDYLIYKNGFKIFKLGDNIKNYSRFVKPLDTNKDMYRVTDTSLLYTWNNIKLKFIMLRTKNHEIYNVYVAADKKDAAAVLKTLIIFYGNPKKHEEPSSYIWGYEESNPLLYYRINEKKDYVGFMYKKPKDVSYAQLKEIRKIEKNPEKYINDI